MLSISQGMLLNREEEYEENFTAGQSDVFCHLDLDSSLEYVVGQSLGLYNVFA